MTARPAAAALRCYPRWWRDVYGEEIGQVTDDLLEDGASEMRIAANLFKGALSARLWARAMPPRADLWSAHARVSIAVATLPLLAVLPFVYFGLDANRGYRTLPRVQVLQLVQSDAAQVTSHMYGLVQLGLSIGLIAALVGWRALHDGVKWSRVLVPSRPRLLLYLPLTFFAVLVALYVARVTQISRVSTSSARAPHVIIQLGGHPAVAAVLLDATWALLAAGSVVTVIAIARVAKVCEVPWKTLVSGRKVAAVTAVVLGVMALCAVVGTVVSGPQGFVTQPMRVGPGNPHTPYTTYMVFPHFALMAVPLAIAAIASFTGWRASRRASTMLSRLDPRIGISEVRL